MVIYLPNKLVCVELVDATCCLTCHSVALSDGMFQNDTRWFCTASYFLAAGDLPDKCRMWFWRTQEVCSVWLQQQAGQEHRRGILSTTLFKCKTNRFHLYNGQEQETYLSLKW